MSPSAEIDFISTRYDKLYHENSGILNQGANKLLYITEGVWSMGTLEGDGVDDRLARQDDRQTRPSLRDTV